MYGDTADVLSYLIIPHHIYLEQYCFQKASLNGLAQCSGVNVVDLVCIFSVSHTDDLALLICGGLVPSEVVHLV